MYFEDKHFKAEDFTLNPPSKGEYEYCSFTDCTFSSADLSGFSFIECEFKGCDLSLAKLQNTCIRETNFTDCKMLGLHFETCNELLLSFQFTGCSLNLSSFYRLSLKKTRFKDCSLHETDFTETDLSQAVFDNCDLSGATFEKTNLEKADFRTSYHFSIHPELNRIKKAKFSRATLSGLLEGYGIEIE